MTQAVENAAEAVERQDQPLQLPGMKVDTQMLDQNGGQMENVVCGRVQDGRFHRLETQ